MTSDNSSIRHRPNLITRTSGSDVLVLDGDRVVALEGDTAKVWTASEGATPAEVAVATGLPESTVIDCLVRIEQADLLEHTGMSRRQMLVRAGAVAAAVPAATILLPMASAAASPLTQATLTVSNVTTGAATFAGTGFTPNTVIGVTATYTKGGTVGATVYFAPSGGGTYSATGSLTADSSGNVSSTTLSISKSASGHSTLPSGSVVTFSASDTSSDTVTVMGSPATT